MATQHLLLFSAVMVATWLVFTYLWPRLMLLPYQRLLDQGGGEGPIPVNTLYTEPQAIFADPLHTPATVSKLWTTGTNHDTLYVVGRLDLSQGPLVLHVPAMGDRYYSVQFTDPANNTNFAYVGTRATGTQAGDYLIAGPGAKGPAPGGMPRIASPNNSVFVIGRVFVENDKDLPIAYNLANQITLTPL